MSIGFCDVDAFRVLGWDVWLKKFDFLVECWLDALTMQSTSL